MDCHYSTAHGITNLDSENDPNERDGYFVLLFVSYITMGCIGYSSLHSRTLTPAENDETSMCRE